MDKINDSEIKNAPPQNGNIANSTNSRILEKYIQLLKIYGSFQY